MNRFLQYLILASFLDGGIFAQQTELTEARFRWSEFDNERYYFELETSQSSETGISLGVQAQLGIHVQENEIQKIDSITVEITDEVKASTPTIDDLFDNIQQAIDHASTVNYIIQIQYDESYGYPTQFLISEDDTTSTTSVTRNGNGILDDPLNMVGAITFFSPTSIKVGEFQDNLDTWNRLQYTSYDMVYQRFVFAPPPFSSKVDIQVRDNAVTQVADVSSGEPITGTTFKTMDELWAELGAAILDDSPIAVDIQYNGAFGYPESVNVDFNKFIADEEFSFEVSEFNLFAVPQHAQQEELDNNKALWESYNVDTYGFGFKRDCFCTDAYRQYLIVQVDSNGDILSIKSQKGESVSQGVQETVSTIDEIFAMVQDAIDEAADEILISYHPVWGFPTSVFINSDSRVSDLANIINLSDFAPGGSSSASSSRVWYSLFFGSALPALAATLIF